MCETAEECFNQNMGVHDSGYAGNQAHLKNPVERERDGFQELTGRILHHCNCAPKQRFFYQEPREIPSHLPKLKDRQ